MDDHVSGEPLSPPPVEPDAPAPPSHRERAVVAVVLAVALLALAGAGGWFAWLWRDPAWAEAVRTTVRVRGTLEAEPTNHEYRARYAQEMLKLAARSPAPLRTYLDWRADRHCADVRAQTPPGTFGSCRQMHLERLLLREDGPGLLSAAQAEMEGSPRHWQAPLHRYAGRGAVFVEDWDIAREHFSTAFALGGKARDALWTGWVCLKSGQPAVGLDWLDRAFRVNGGYPPPYRQVVARSMIAPDERDRYLAAIDAEAAFYDACRAAAHAALEGEPHVVPEWPE